MRAGSRPQYRRLRRIVEMLNAGMRSRRSPTMADFQRELEVSRRTIARDLDFLRMEESAPIAYDPRARSYRLTERSFALPPIEVSGCDLATMAAARAALGDASPAPAARAMGAVIGKIAEAAPAGYAEILDKISGRFGALHEAPARIEPDIWAILAEAVARSLVVAARYRRFDGTERDYLIEPLQLVAHRGNWYALAKKRPSGELRAFALSRFGSATPTDETFVPPNGFDWRKASKDAFGIAIGINPMNVRLLFSKTIATAISERIWHPTQRIRIRRDGSVELQMRAAPTIDLVRWILSWTPDVRVLAPRTLRARVGRHLRPSKRGPNQVCGKPHRDNLSMPTR